MTESALEIDAGRQERLDQLMSTPPGATPERLGQELLEEVSKFGGSTTYMETLISLGADVNIQDQEGNTALIHSLSAANKHATSLLLDHHADPNIANNLKYMPLTFAIWHFLDDAAIRLINNGANINHKDALDGNTPLISAVYGFQDDVITALLEKGARVCICNNHGKNALDAARETPLKPEIIERLEKAEEDQRHIQTTSPVKRLKRMQLKKPGQG